MTAEVVIINRGAVALAADSAMTVSGGSTPDKIYNTADKIFEMSRHDPIGLMIFNNLDFMGVPLDVAIKVFRDSESCKSCKSVDEMAENFFNFLLKDVKADLEAEQRHIESIANGLFRYVQAQFDKDIEQEIVVLSKTGTIKDFDAHKIFLAIVKSATEEFLAAEIAMGFETISEAKLLEKYSSTIDRAIRAILGEMPLDKSDFNLLRKMVVTYLNRNLFSAGLTGFVFAGYAGDDLFPSLAAFEVDGIVAGKIKKRKIKSVKIDRSNNTAEIIPFAQHEMADRFLFGIDPDFENEIPDYLESAMRLTGKALIKDGLSGSKKKMADLEMKLDKAIDVTVREFRENVVVSIKEVFKKQIQGMAAFMPKQELADFAKSLVDITSIKRRVSAEQETVGGPIDVAVISRSDGFVWVQRKHYFKPDLNPRYFSRKFRDK